MEVRVIILVSFVATSVSAFDAEGAKTRLVKLFKSGNIPKGMPDWLAVLDDSTGIFNCFPSIKEGRCYKSRQCRLPKLKFDGKLLPFVLKLCKDPWQIIIDFLPLDLPWYAKVELRPFVINIINNDRHGIFRIKSDTTIKAKVRYINLGVYKASLSINGVLRYDCTKPRGGGNWMQRARYNKEAPAGANASGFYKLKIRMEIKKKRFNWFKFNYTCKRCEDLVNKSGRLGSPNGSCQRDNNRYYDYLERERRRRRCRFGRCYEPE